MSTTVKFTTPPCQVCSKTSEVELDAEKVRHWQGGAFIQDVFPELTDDQRELIISSTPRASRSDLFGEEDE